MNLFDNKYFSVPNIINEWTSEYGGLSAKSILEFGCGVGITALGVANTYKPNFVLGVDISEQHINLQSECSRNGIKVSSLGNLSFGHSDILSKRESLRNSFDIVYSWSVFEHVNPDEISRALITINRCLKVGGLFFLQISPLFYSAYGSHLNRWVPMPWAHLILQQSKLKEMLFGASESSAEIKDEWSAYVKLGSSKLEERNIVWAVYESLNRLTAEELIKFIEAENFDIIRVYKTYDEVEPPSDLARTYGSELLKTNQIVILAQKRDIQIMMPRI
jgi:2-polyprenyl-3-methyl-5-hydroxy-6-metoxy-1,4-benzoquinol methylase